MKRYRYIQKILLPLGILLVFAGLYFISIMNLGDGPEVDYLVDASNSRDIDAFERSSGLQWKKLSSPLYSTITRDQVSYWFKTSLHNSSPRVEKWVVEVGSTYIKNVVISSVGADGKISEKRFDQSLSSDQRRAHVYKSVINLSPQSTTTVYVLAQAKGFVFVPLAVMKEADYENWYDGHMLFYGLFFGTMFALIIYNLFIFISAHDVSYLYYALYQLFTTMFHLSYIGFSFKIAPILRDYDNLSRAIPWVAINLSTSFGISFLRDFANLKRYPWINSYAKKIAGVSLILAFCSFFIPKNVIGPLTFGALFSAVIVYLVLVPKVFENKNFYFYFLAWIGVDFSIPLSLAVLVGAIPSGALTLKIEFIGIMLEALILSLALGLKLRLLNEERVKIKQIIAGAAPRTELNEILEQVDQRVTSEEAEVTMMFIDIVGFSMISEKMAASEIYRHLSRFMDQLNRIIYNYGGTIDRSLGDGVLCFFGYDDPPTKNVSHPTRAFLAAKEIQEMSVQWQASSSLTENMVFPVRIGINTDKVYIGNLGGSGRVDFSMVGNGVNFASRLESACNPFKIMISSYTKSLIDPGCYDNHSMLEILIQIKHYSELLKAFEYNVFTKNSESLIKAEKRYYEQLGRFAVRKRYRLTGNGTIALSGDFGAFEVTDISKDGFGVKSDLFVAPSSCFYANIVTDLPHVNGELSKNLLDRVYLEVRWSRLSKDCFKLGFKIIGLSDRQKDALISALKDFVELEQNTSKVA